MISEFTLHYLTHLGRVGKRECHIGKPGRPGKAYVDIEAALAMQLFEAGIDHHKLSIMHRCTYEESELFFSYRRDRASSGAMTSYLKLNS